MTIILLTFVATMYIRVELDFKKNVFRVAGHLLATILLLLTLLNLGGIADVSILLEWFLISALFLLINETIRIYLRRHSMSDLLQNHPRLYWLVRGCIGTKENNR